MTIGSIRRPCCCDQVHLRSSSHGNRPRLSFNSADSPVVKPLVHAESSKSHALKTVAGTADKSITTPDGTVLKPIDARVRNAQVVHRIRCMWITGVKSLARMGTPATQSFAVVIGFQLAFGSHGQTHKPLGSLYVVTLFPQYR